MFSRIKGAIDRTIAEEQARQRAFADQNQPGHTRQSGSVSRSNSGASAASKKPRPRKAAQDASSKDAESAAANPDPAVFEAAFTIDDEEPSRVATPIPSTDQKASQDGEDPISNSAEATEGEKEDNGNDKGKEKEKDDSGSGATGKTPEKSNASSEKRAGTSDLPADVRAKLRKLEKLEGAYPGESSLPSMSETRHGLSISANILHFLSLRTTPVLPHCPRTRHLDRAL